MNILKPFRKPLEQFAPWDAADAYRARGFLPIAVERWAAERGPLSWADPHSWEAPLNGAYTWGLGAPTDPENWVVSILPGVLPREGGLSLPEAAATWCPVLRIDAPSKRAARAIAPLLAGALVRDDIETGDVLALFRADVADVREYDFRGDSVVLNASGCVIPSGPRFTWRDGRSPATVSRTELRALTWDDARTLFCDIDAALRERAA